MLSAIGFEKCDESQKGLFVYFNRSFAQASAVQIGEIEADEFLAEKTFLGH
jgi:hypothetical protein